MAASPPAAAAAGISAPTYAGYGDAVPRSFSSTGTTPAVAMRFTQQPPCIGGRLSSQLKLYEVGRRFLQAAADTGSCQQPQQHVPAHWAQLAAILLDTAHLPAVYPIG